MAKADKHKGLSTKNLKNLLNKEEQKMALVGERRKQGNNGPEGEDPNVVNAEANNSTNEVSMEDINAELDGLAGQADAAAAEDSNTQGKTDLFTSETISKAKTAKEKTEAEKEADFKDKQKTIREKNKMVNAEKAKLISSTKTITAVQQLYQQLCADNFVLDALIFDKGPKARVNVNVKLLRKNKDEYIFRDEVAPDKQVQINNGSLPLKQKEKLQFVKAETSISYGLTGPQKLRGGVVTMPRALMTTSVQLRSPDFQVPDQSVIDSSEKVTLVATKELLFYYIAVCCGGKMQESDIIDNNPIVQHNKSSRGVIAEYKVIFKKKNYQLTGESETVPYFHVAGRKLAIKENVIPYTVYENKPLTSLTGPDKEALNEFLSDKFANYNDYAGNTAYETLREGHRGLVSKIGDTNKFTMNFLNDSTLLTAAGLTATDWGTAQYGQSKDTKVTLDNYPMPVYEKAESNGKIVKRLVTKVLGSNLTLEDLATTYPAAARVVSLGIKAEDIAAVVEVAKNAETSARKAKRKPQEKYGQVVVEAEQTIFGSRDITASFLDNLGNNTELAGGFDVMSLNKQINSAVYKR